MKLYELAQAMDVVINGGLIYDDVTGEVVFDASNLEELTDDLNEKVEACCIVAKEIEAEAEAIRAEEAKLKKRRERKEREAKRLREYVAANMDACGIRNVETPRVGVSVRRSKFVNVVDESMVPSEFVREKVTTSVDRAGVLKALKSGVAVAGCEIGERSSLKIE